MTTRLLVIPALAGFLFTAFSSAAAVKTSGTYQIVPVQTRAECSALCQADPVNCVGTVFVETMSSSGTTAVCEMNNGEGEQSPFEARTPAPFDLQLAETELNVYRAQYGLNPVRLNPLLTLTSQLHSDDQASMDDASHSSSDGTQLDVRVQRQGYQFRLAAENVASGQLSWDRVFQAWKDSPGHNENLLMADVTEVGIAMTYKKDTEYKVFWTMVLGSPLNLTQPDM